MEMADIVEITPEAIGDSDFAEHEATYRLFLTLLKSAIAVIGGVLILLAIFVI
jgi:hypothetical protein